MFRIETVQFASQDDLPAEIQRRLQVEELWARRDVLAELMNAERLEDYTRRRGDILTASGSADIKSKNTKPSATVMAIRPRKSGAPVVLVAQDCGT